MRKFKHILNVVIGGVALAGIVLFATTSHRSTPVVAPATVRAIATSATAGEMRPIFAVDAMGGGGEVGAMNKSD